MPTTVRLTNLTKHPNGSVSAMFSDGSGFVYNSLTELLQTCTDVDLDVELVKRMCISYAAARSADLSNINSVLNKDFTFNLSSPAPIRVQ